MSKKQVPAEDKGASQEIAPGAMIAGKYKVLRVLGRGGYGIVYLVEITSGMIGQQLALKLVSRDVGGDEKVQRRFINEIRVAMSLVNKYIVQVRDVGTTDDGLLFYTMDFSPGVTLSEIIKADSEIGIARSCLIALRILRGLFTAHDQGVIHRDLKPANIMVEAEGDKETVKILDFGIATAAQDQPSKSKTFVGSPYYMPPEQFLGEGLGPWSDLYSVGVMLYECLTDTRPYHGASVREIYDDIKSRPVESPRAINPELNQCLAVVRVVMKALERKPESRYQTAREFFDELNSAYRSWRNKHGQVKPRSAPGTAPRPRPTTSHAARRPRREVSTVGVTLLTWGSILVVGAAAALYFMNRGGKRPETVRPPEPKFIEEVEKSKETIFDESERIPTPIVIRKRDPVEPQGEQQASELFADLLAQWQKGTIDAAAVRDRCVQIRALQAELAPPYELLGHAEMTVGQWDSAYQSYQTALSLYEDQGMEDIAPELHLNIALTRARSGSADPEEAKLYYLKALEIDPKHEEITIALAEVLENENLGWPTELLDLLHSARERGIQHPRIDELYEKYFVLLPRVEQERTEKIRAEIDEAYNAQDFETVVKKGIELFTEDPSTDLGLRIATAHRERWEFDKGLDMMHTVVHRLARSGDERSKDVEFLANLAMDFARLYIEWYESGQGDSRSALDDALMNLTTAVNLAQELDKKNPLPLHRALSYRARCYLYLGDTESLQRDLKHVSASKNAFVVFHQAETLYLLGEETVKQDSKHRYLAQAVARFDRATHLVDRKDTLLTQQIYFKMGLVYYALGGRTDWNKAKSKFNRASKAGLDTPELHMALGRTLVELNKKREAAKEFRKSYNLEPSIDACHEAVVWFFTANARKSAVEMLKIGLKEFPKSKELKELKEFIDL